MFCFKCGTEIPDDSVYCHICGTKMVNENTDKKVSDITAVVQKQQKAVTSEILFQNAAKKDGQDFEISSEVKDDGNSLKDLVSDHIWEEQQVPDTSIEFDRSQANSKNSQYGKDVDKQSPKTDNERAEKKFGNHIKPYYCEEFERIASGQKPKFNWAAFFLNGWIQLYNGCTGIFCKTFLPLLIALFLTSLIGLLGMMRFDLTLMSISSVLGILVGICSLVLCTINGFCFNKWYYQDVINKPEKKRSRKGLWFLIVAEIAIIIILQLAGRMVTKDIVGSFDGYYDESDFDNDFYDDSYSDLDDDSIGDLYGDLPVEHSEDLVSIQGENLEDSMIDTAQYEEIAREIIIEWFSRHPLRHNFRIEFMNETANTEDGSGIYLNYEMYWDDDEWYGTFYVNPDTGDMVMDSMIMATGPTSVQESMDQWYLEDYWFLGEDMGGYLEDYGDGIYGMYNSGETLVLEYYAESDAYAICDYDGQCFIEYDDGSETSEIGISDFTGTYAYDGSFDAEGMFVDFYYLLEIGEWDGCCFPIVETWRGNTILQEEWARPKRLIVDTLFFDISSPDGAGYETHSLTYVPAEKSSLGKDVIYIDGDDTMPFARE